MSSEQALIELHYFPSVQYFTKLIRYGGLLIESHENYQKGGYRNRCLIASANGILRLSVPLEGGKHQQQPVRDVRISWAETWHIRHWRSIVSAYGNSPFFLHYGPQLEEILQKRHSFLFDLNMELFQALAGMLGIQASIHLTGAYHAGGSGDPLMKDLRNRISPQKSADPDFNPAFYPQVFQDRFGFIPNLSILDLIFCSGPNAREILEKSVCDKKF